MGRSAKRSSSGPSRRSLHDPWSGAAVESPRDDGAAPPRHLIRALVRAVAADPEFLAERLAVFAVGWWGPHADRTVAELRRRRPDADAEDLRQTTVTHSVRTCVAEGAFIGGPFTVLVPFAFCSALLVQIRMILELAALTERHRAHCARRSTSFPPRSGRRPRRRGFQAGRLWPKPERDRCRPMRCRPRAAGCGAVSLRGPRRMPAVR